MASYFNLFPKIMYNGKETVDIVRRAYFIKHLRDNPFVILPYTVMDGEKPEDLAHYYYGSVEYLWAVTLPNEIYDLNTDWPMTDDVFQNYLIRKYEEISKVKGHLVLNWLQKTQTNFYENVAYYYNEEKDVKISVDTVKLMGTQAGFEPVRYYEIEFQENDNKRHIQLIDKKLINDVERQFKRLISQ